MAKPIKRGLLEQSIPLPAGQGYPQSPGPDAGYGGTLNNLSYGIGTGMRNQLAGLLDMARNPMQYGNALLQAAMHPSQSLPAIGNALADQYRMATSGAAGFGQVLGENISPRGLLGVTAAAVSPASVTKISDYIKAPKRLLSKKEMIDRGADGFLSRAHEMDVPLDKLDGLEPVPAADTLTGKYAPGREITQPIEVVYDAATDKYIVYGGNHRIAQARANGQKSIKAFVEPDGGLLGSQGP